MQDPTDLAIYIHWPYCARICPYCDFNVYKGRENANVVAAIVSDLAYWRQWSGPRNITSIHFGGGTPSLLQAKDVGGIISQVNKLWSLDADAEIALEANPNDAGPEKWQGLRAAGITRLSLGVQSFHDEALSLLGRDHNGIDAQQSFDLALSLFPSVSLDLIFGWQGQTAKQWEVDLNIATTQCDAPHMSAYQLTIEEGTAFAKAESRGQKKAVGEDVSADFYDMTREALLGAGYDHYEVSNYAKPGHHSKHNLTYWTGGDYVGVGPGAHGRLTVSGQRYETIAAMSPNDYIDTVAEHHYGMEYRKKLSQLDWAQEYVLMGLRISQGISLSRFKEIAGQDLPQDPLHSLSKAGLLFVSGDSLSATPQGRLVLNRITQELLETI